MSKELSLQKFVHFKNCEKNFFMISKLLNWSVLEKMKVFHTVQEFFRNVVAELFEGPMLCSLYFVMTSGSKTVHRTFFLRIAHDPHQNLCRKIYAIIYTEF